MGVTTESLIYEMAFRFRMLQSVEQKTGGLTERETIILELINLKQEMNISEIAAMHPSVSSSTISNTITKLWRVDKLVNKTVNPDNQRITNVSLTKKGEKAVKGIKVASSKVFDTLIEALSLTEEEEKIFNVVLKRGVNYFDKFFSSAL